MYKRSNLFQNSYFYVKDKWILHENYFQTLKLIYSSVYILYVGAYLLVKYIYIVYFTYVR